jgi:hypothetical protein
VWGPGWGAVARQALEHQAAMAQAAPAAACWRPDRDASGDLLIWSSNLPAVSAWLLVGDQWRGVEMGSQLILAIDLGVALDVVRMMELPNPIAVISDLKLIQVHYLQEVVELESQRRAK